MKPGFERYRGSKADAVFYMHKIRDDLMDKMALEKLTPTLDFYFPNNDSPNIALY